MSPPDKSCCLQERGAPLVLSELIKSCTSARRCSSGFLLPSRMSQGEEATRPGVIRMAGALWTSAHTSAEGLWRMVTTSKPHFRALQHLSWAGGGRFGQDGARKSQRGDGGGGGWFTALKTQGSSLGQGRESMLGLAWDILFINFLPSWLTLLRRWPGKWSNWQEELAGGNQTGFCKSLQISCDLARTGKGREPPESGS